MCVCARESLCIFGNFHAKVKWLCKLCVCVCIWASASVQYNVLRWSVLKRVQKNWCTQSTVHKHFFIAIKNVYIYSYRISNETNLPKFQHTAFLLIFFFFFFFFFPTFSSMPHDQDTQIIRNYAYPAFFFLSLTQRLLNIFVSILSGFGLRSRNKISIDMIISIFRIEEKGRTRVSKATNYPTKKPEREKKWIASFATCTTFYYSF